MTTSRLLSHVLNPSAFPHRHAALHMVSQQPCQMCDVVSSNPALQSWAILPPRHGVTCWCAAGLRNLREGSQCQGAVSTQTVVLEKCQCCEFTSPVL